MSYTPLIKAPRLLLPIPRIIIVNSFLLCGMDSEITLSSIQVLDSLLRAATAGIMLFLCVLPSHTHQMSFGVARRWLLVCLASYVMLTTPIDNADYGWFRPPLLLMTDLTAMALLNLYWFFVHKRTLWDALSLWAKIAVLVWCSALAVFFLVFKGKGSFHDFIHWTGLAMLVFVILDAARGYTDDLAERTRQLRRLSILGLSTYMSMLTILELIDSDLRDNPYFSFGHAAFMFLLTLAVSAKILRSRLASDAAPPPDLTELTGHPQANNECQSKHAKAATEAMQNGLYLHHDLKVDGLAQQIGVPAHQLRKVINQELGFDNFSQFVNEFRIERVCQELQKTERHGEPILTVALESGFSSIASFNRVFKANKSITPTEYRAQFQK